MHALMVLASLSRAGRGRGASWGRGAGWTRGAGCGPGAGCTWSFWSFHERAADRSTCTGAMKQVRTSWYWFQRRRHMKQNSALQLVQVMRRHPPFRLISKPQFGQARMLGQPGMFSTDIFSATVKMRIRGSFSSHPSFPQPLILILLLLILIPFHWRRQAQQNSYGLPKSRLQTSHRSSISPSSNGTHHVWHPGHCWKPRPWLM